MEKEDEIIIQLPNDLSVKQICEFSIELDQVPPAEKYVFDFGGKRYFTPFSMILLSCLLRHFAKKTPSSRRTAINHTNHPYAANIGFFQSFGLDHGNSPGYSTGNSNFVPITKIDVSSVKRRAHTEKRHFAELLTDEANRLADVIAQKNRNCSEVLTFAIREMLRNSVEHGGVATIWVCAQCWPTKNLVEVGILDEGVGIASSLRDNSLYDELSDIEALRYSLLPGVSGNRAAGLGKGDWHNSGYGLYMTSKMFEEFGEFTIISDRLCLSQSKVNGSAEMDANIDATAVRLLMDTRSIDDLSDITAKLKETGLAEAKLISGANSKLVSKSSQSLKS